MGKVFLVKVKKEQATANNSVPMHPEFSYTGSLGSNMWEAKNMKTGETVRVTMQEKGEFVEYEVEEKA